MTSDNQKMNHDVGKKAFSKNRAEQEYHTKASPKDTASSTARGPANKAKGPPGSITYSKYARRHAKQGIKESKKLEQSATKLGKDLSKNKRTGKIAKDLYHLQKQEEKVDFADKRVSNAEHSLHTRFHLKDGTGVSFRKKLTTATKTTVKNELKPSNIAKRSYNNKKQNIKQDAKQSVTSQFDYVDDQKTSKTEQVANEGKYRVKRAAVNKGKEVLHQKKEIHKLKKDLKAGDVDVKRESLLSSSKQAKRKAIKQKQIFKEHKEKNKFVNRAISKVKNIPKKAVTNAKSSIQAVKLGGKIFFILITNIVPILICSALIFILIGTGSCVGCAGGVFTGAGTAAATTYESDPEDMRNVVNAYTSIVNDEINRQIEQIKRQYEYIELPDIRSNNGTAYTDYNYSEENPTYYNNTDGPMSREYSFNPYQLTSYLSAKYGTYALDGDLFSSFGIGTTGVRGELAELAQSQVQVTATWEMKTYSGKVYQYKLETASDPLDESSPVPTFVPVYDDSMGLTDGCTDQHLVFSVSGKNLEDVIPTKLDNDQMSLYQGYLDAMGNMPDLFGEGTGVSYTDNGNGSYTLENGTVVSNSANYGNYGFDGNVGSYPGTSWNDIASYASSRGATYLYECTTFAAFRFKQMTGLDIPIVNGKDMAASLVAAYPDRYRLSNEPAPGAIFSTGPSASNPYGHVGVVEGVSGNNITISDGNTLNTTFGPLTNYSSTGYAQHNQVTLSKQTFTGQNVATYGWVCYAVPIR